jgi:hypothetical protein
MPNAFCCQPTVKVHRNGWTVSTQVPTFYLLKCVQGILNEEAAKELVRRICNPIDDMSVAVTENVTEVDIN